jgi:hypothetical protein
MQTAPFAQGVVLPLTVIGEPEALMNTLEVDEVGPRVMLTVYVPATTDAASTRSTESVCRRVASTELTRGVRGTGLPEEGVRVIPAIGSVKLSRVTPVGGVSNMVMLTLALPPPPPPPPPPPLLFRPLQETSGRTAMPSISASKRFEFMHIPQVRIWMPPPSAWDDLEAP